jgi:hypothetical protein
MGLIGASYPNTQDDPTLALDYSFSVLFHPDVRDTVGSGNGWIDHALACLPDGRAVSATMAPNFGVTLTTWGVDVDGSTITKLAASAPQGASNSQALFNAGVQAIHLGDHSVVTATTKGNPSLNNPKPGASIKLSLWNVAPNGTPGLVVEDVPAGVGASARLLPIDGSQFLLAYVDQQGKLALAAWRVDSRNVQTKLVSVGSLNTSLAVDQVSVAGPFVVGALYYFATAVRRTDTGTVANELWSFDPVGGTIAAVGSFPTTIAASRVSITAVPVEQRLPDDEIFRPIYFATAVRTDAGFLRVFYGGVDFDFDGFKDFTKRGDTGNTTLATLEQPSLVPFGSSGLVTAIKDGDAKQRVVVWESRRNADDTITPYRIAEHQVPTFQSNAIQACAVPTNHAEADLVSENLALVGGVDGSLQVRAWRIADRP